MSKGRFAALIAAMALLAARAASAAPLLAGFYLPWDDTSQASLAAHAGALQVLAPMSAAVDSPQGHVRWQPDRALAALRAKSRPGSPKVFPVLSNAHDEIWDVAAAEAAMTNPAAGRALADQLVAKAAAEDYGGYVLDFENLTPKGLAAYAPFLARLHAALKPAGRELWVTATMGQDPAFIGSLAKATDAVVLMAYDQCWATSTPGPIAGDDWLAQTLDARLAVLDPTHTIVALGAYGYDWPQNPDGKGGVAKVVSVTEAEALARLNHAHVVRATPDGNPHFAYNGGDGKPHQVWWLDAAAFRAQRAAALARHVRGVAIWRLGLEDPALWTKPTAARPLRPGPAPAACAMAAH
ncbi:glycosyl hydrolase family 18 protein [Phenylobacterium sp.]|jgi:spore germination protein YaaH|uniref:glycosyl hydrolase family 18 protein n=1 Tax=Phenylobacterium sp. TaxID=1871053 RepID=UPI002F4105AD